MNTTTITSFLMRSKSVQLPIKFKGDNLSQKDREYIASKYKVNRNGTIYRVFKNHFKILKPEAHSSGYRKYTFTLEDGTKYKEFVHRFVFYSHNPNLIQHGKKLVIDHINNNKHDNSILNLRELTYKENSQAYLASKRNSTKKAAQE